MALVHDHIGQFAPFPRDRDFSSDLLSQSAAPRLNTFHPSSTTEMDYNTQLASLPRTAYDLYPASTSYANPSAYYAAHKNSVSALKVGDESFIPRPTPSASPSSMSQTFDQPLSALSSTSGASAQSAASSVGGSPYARPTQQMPFQDKWSDPLQGLGISSGIGNSDFTGYDPSRQDFVGEYQDSLSSLPSAGPSPSSISLAPTSQEFSLNTVCLSETSEDSQSAATSIDAIVPDMRWISTDDTNLVSASASNPDAASRLALSSTTQNMHSIEEDRALALHCVKSASTTPQPLSISQIHSNSSPVDSRMSHIGLSPLSTSPTSLRKHQDPFFCQSSGRFVAPLHSSCWFSSASSSVALFVLVQHVSFVS